MSPKPKLGGYPVGIVAAVQAAVAVAISFGWLDVIGLHGQPALAAVTILLNAGAAVYLAWSTSATLLAPVIELFKALIGLGAIYGLHLTNEQTGMVVALITAVFAAFHQTQTSPLDRGSFRLAA